MILIFAGAGASKAVSPDQYPTTVEFFEKLPDDILSNELFKRAVEYLRQPDKFAVIDIEQVLWTLRELQEFTTKAGDKKSVPGWFIQGNRLSSAAGTGENLQSMLNVASPATQKLNQLTSRINEIVYDLYADVPAEKDLKTNWLPLLEGLMELKQPIEIVTTNYDLVIEEAIAFSNAPVNPGRTQKTQPTLEVGLWDVTDLSSRASLTLGLLTKLHGSVDWARGRSNRIHVGNPNYMGDHKKHAIIYPGFKGEPTDDLFKQLHLYFQATLSRSDVIVFIGYAFRDEYINAVVSRQMKPHARVLVLNPAKLLPDMPLPQKSYTQISAGFDLASIKRLLIEIKLALRS